MLREYHTPRLVVRAWTREDAPARKAAIDANLDRLRPWFPWAASDPRAVEEHARLLDGQVADFAAGHWWSYGVWRAHPAGAAALVGALGVYRARQDAARPSVRELSYWLTREFTGQGIASEAVGALADAALAEPGVLALEIRVDPANVASARVPPRLGFALRERLVGDRTGPDGQPLDTCVWERVRAPVRLRPAVPGDVPRLQAIHAVDCEHRLASPGLVTIGDYHALVAAGWCWVWADDQGVRGFAAAHPSGAPEVWALCVDPPAAGHGVGAALLAQITDVLWASGYRRLTVSTVAGSRAERVYRAAGWVAVGATPAGEVQLRRDL